jgi:hypothetical protein
MGEGYTLSVMPGLEPGIHDESPESNLVKLDLREGLMDCRVKPGNDI